MNIMNIYLARGKPAAAGALSSKSTFQEETERAGRRAGVAMVRR